MLLLGTGSNDYIGNIHYRKLVRHVLASAYGVEDPREEFASAASAAAATPPITVRRQGQIFASSADAVDKATLARQIVYMIKARGGRFLEPVSARPGQAAAAAENRSHAAAGGIASNSVYREVSDTVSIDKTKQSFRHQLKTLQQNMGLAELPPNKQDDTISTSPNRKRQWEAQVLGDDPAVAEVAVAAAASASGLASKYRRLLSMVKQEQSAGDMVTDVFIRALASNVGGTVLPRMPLILPGLSSTLLATTPPSIDERLLSMLMMDMPTHPPPEVDLHKAILLQLLSLKRTHQQAPPPLPIQSLRLLHEYPIVNELYPAGLLCQEQPSPRSGFIPSWAPAMAGPLHLLSATASDIRKGPQREEKEEPRD